MGQEIQRLSGGKELGNLPFSKPLSSAETINTYLFESEGFSSSFLPTGRYVADELERA
jgi:hypothetical protein